MPALFTAAILSLFGVGFVMLSVDMFSAGPGGQTYYYGYLAGAPLKIEIADTPDERQLGLSGRDGLPENHGLLFVFEKADTYGIWMKDMTFAIDVIWLSEDMRVVHIERSVAPESFPKVYRPDEPALFVLETPAGFAEHYSVAEGEKISILSYTPTLFNKETFTLF